ncbi:MAG: hypothetical protein EBV06_11995, partial [Planctomycetia bacterium]|nr:hypothetical protein [Planctomycetia bacterium]
MRHLSAEPKCKPRRPNGPLTLVLATALTAVALAQPGRTQVPTSYVAPPVKPAVVAPPVAEPKPEPKIESRPAGKKLAFSMDSKPWSGMFKWVSDQTGIPVIHTIKPTGTFSFTSPPGAAYELTEVIDIINEALLAQKYYLLNKGRNWIVVAADEKIDPAFLPTINVEELNDRGRNELVRLSMGLKTIQATEIAPEIKKLMGPFGEVTVLEKFNQLYLQDTGGNLRRIKKILDDLEKKEVGSTNSASYKCEWIKVIDAERMLKDQLGDSNKLIPSASSGGGGDRRGPGGGPPAPAPVVDTKKLLFITSDERNNTLLFNGPVDKIAEAEALAKKLDVKREGIERVLIGEASLKTYTVPSGTAESMQKILQDTFKSPSLRIFVAGNKLLVHAFPQDQYDIAKKILEGSEVKDDTKNITLDCGDQDAEEVVKTIATFLGDTKTGGPIVEAIKDRNAVLVRGNDEQIKLVKELLTARGGKGTTGVGKSRSITLEGGSAPLLAEEIARLMSRLRKNPVEIVSPDKLRDEDAKRREEEKKKKPGDKDTRLATPRELETTALLQDGGLIDPRDDKKKAKTKPDDTLPGDSDKPIRIFASGNRLMLASDDPDALALISQLINVYTKSPGKGDFTVLKLKNVSATDAAKALDEAFNGKGQQGGPGGGMGGGRGGGGGFNPLGMIMGGMMGGGGPAAGGTEDANRIRVVAYPATNSLLVRATPLDMLMIRNLLAKALDPDEDEGDLIQTYIMPLKHASASDVSYLLKDVFPAQTKSSSSSSSNMQRPNPFSMMMGGGMGGMPTSSGSGSSAPMMSIGVDDRNNRLIVACPERMYKSIKKLVDDIDEASKDSVRTIRVVNVKGIDPMLVQQVINAVQGIRPNTRGGF